MKHSQVGILGQEAWLGSLEARHTAPFLMAVPESNISETVKCTTYRFFLARLFECLNTSNIQKTPITFVLGKCNRVSERVFYFLVLRIFAGHWRPKQTKPHESKTSAHSRLGRQYHNNHNLLLKQNHHCFYLMDKKAKLKLL